MQGPALTLLQFASIADGIVAADAMVKRAPVEVVVAGTVHPGHYIVLVAGDVASVEEAHAAGMAVCEPLDGIFLPDVDPRVVAAVRGHRLPRRAEALGIVETTHAAATVSAADVGVKGADVDLAIARLADDLGGKGYILFTGATADVEAAVELATARAGAACVASRVVTMLHDEVAANLFDDARFGIRLERS